jgi:hypothetical protein
MPTPSTIDKLEGEIHRLTEASSHVTEHARGLRNSTFARFPIIFTLLTTFGLVATLYGFEKVIDRIDFFTAYPEVLLLIGLVTLAGTGTLYKKLR